MFRRTYAEINLDHLAHNVRLIQKNFPGAFLCPMVKANAYGHGEARVAKVLESLGVKHIGVCTIDEGLALRRADIGAEILVFLGGDESGFKALLEARLTPVVTNWSQLDAVEKAAAAPTGLHLKFDTGMHRLGFQITDAEKLRARLKDHPKLKVQGVATHLHSGEDAAEAEGQSALQLRRLDEIAKLFPGALVHALNSAGILSDLALRRQGDLALRRQKENPAHPLRLRSWGLRPGLMIYGYNPLPDQTLLDLKPVMTFKAAVVAVQPVPKGDGVSYNHRWKAGRDSFVAVVGAGYADGYHRILTNKGEALFKGRRVPVVGTVCMDYLLLDVTDLVENGSPEKLLGEEVVLFGEAKGDVLSAAELAQRAQTISWEVLTSVSARVPRIFKEKGLIT